MSNMKKKELKKSKEKLNFSSLSPTRRLVLAIVLFTLAIILFLGLCGLAGVAGELLSIGLKIILGWASWTIPIALAIVAIMCLNHEKIQEIYPKRPFGIRLAGLFFSVVILAAIFHIHFVDNKLALAAYKGGGYIGYGISYVIVNTFGIWASWVIFVCAFAVGLIVAFSNLKKKLSKEELEAEALRKKENLAQAGFQSLKAILAKKEKLVLKPDNEKDKILEKTEDSLKSSKGIAGFGSTKIRSKIELPLDLLDSSTEKPNSGDIKNNKLIIQKTLESFGIPVEMGEVKTGPTVTQYTLKPADGVKISQITGLQNDLALALAAHPIRIEAPIPGQSLVGIEIPNKQKAVVRLREVFESAEFRKNKTNLSLAIGKDVAGEIWFGDLGKMPHLLVAGSTGSGKTVMLNSVIVNLIYQNSPEDLKFIFIDPKRVELTLYNDLPHLLTPVITDVNKTINALKWSIKEMERRFEVMSQVQKRDIFAYNKDAKTKMPFIVVVIDELADLMITSPQEVEACIIRLSQMARATGIHLIMATQRPSVDIITGLIKANITSRIAFSVASMTDSRTILDFSGAEKLLGRGDMLFISSELSKPKRLQGDYVSDEEIKRIVEYLRNVAKPEYQDEIVAPPQNESGKDLSDLVEDEMLSDAREVVIQAGKASASLLQRRLRIGYARAARLLDLLEEEETIGPGEGAKPRDVYKKMPND